MGYFERLIRSRPVARLLLLAALVGAVVVACDDGLGPDRLVRVQVSPRFQEIEGAVQDPATLVDNVRFRFGSAFATVTDTIVAWPVGQDTLEADVLVNASGSSQNLQYLIEARIVDMVIFEAEGTLDLSTIGDGGTAVLAPTLAFIGQGASATEIEILDPPPSIQAAGRRQLAAEVRDSSGTVLETVAVVWESLDTASASVTGDTVEAASRLDRSARIAARVAYVGVADTIEMDVVAAGLEVTASRDTLNALGQTVLATAAPLDADGQQTTGGTVTWSASGALGSLSAEPLEAEFEASAVGAGSLIGEIDGFADTVGVAVRQIVASLGLTAPADTLASGSTLSLAVAPADSNANAVADADIAYASSDTGIATVDAAGLVTGVLVGTAAITASAGGTSDSAAVTVIPGPAAAMAVAPASVDFAALGDTATLTATVTDAAGNAVAGTPTWGSTAGGVVSISAAGLATALTNGSASLTATLDSLADTASATVAQVATTAVVSADTVFFAEPGDTVTVTGTLTDALGSAMAIGSPSWTSDDTAVASVSPSGLITGVTPGNTWVRVSQDGATDSVRVLVTQFFDGDLVIATQASLDSVAAGFYGTIGGSLLVQSTSLTDVDGLESIRTVQGDLRVEDNASLASIEGLRGVREVTGSYSISGNAVLQAPSPGAWYAPLPGARAGGDRAGGGGGVAGGEALQGVGGDLLVLDNAQLQNLDFLGNLAAVGGDIFIERNAALEHLDGMTSLTTLSGTLYLAENPSLSSLNNLPNVTDVNGLHIADGAEVFGMPALQTIRDDYLSVHTYEVTPTTRVLSLPSLTCVGSDVAINNNDVLETIELGALERIDHEACGTALPGGPVAAGGVEVGASFPAARAGAAPDTRHWRAARALLEELASSGALHRAAAEASRDERMRAAEEGALEAARRAGVLGDDAFAREAAALRRQETASAGAAAGYYYPGVAATADLFIVGNPSLTAVEVPALVRVRNQVVFQANGSLTSIDLPVLETIGSHLVLNEPAPGATLSAPSLDSIGSNLQVSIVSDPLSIALPALTTLGGNVWADSIEAGGRLAISLPEVVGTVGEIDVNTNHGPVDVLVGGAGPAGIGPIEVWDAFDSVTVSAPTATDVSGDVDVFNVTGAVRIDLPEVATIAQDVDIFDVAAGGSLHWTMPALDSLGEDIDIFTVDGPVLLEFGLRAMGGDLDIFDVFGTGSLTLDFPNLVRFPIDVDLFDVQDNAVVTLDFEALETIVQDLDIFDIGATASLDFNVPSLVSVAEIDIFTARGIDSLAFPALVEVTDGIRIDGTSVTTLSFPELVRSASLDIEADSVLTRLSAPKLDSLSGDLDLEGNPVLDSVDVSSLRTARSFSFERNPALGGIRAPMLTTLSSSFTVDSIGAGATVVANALETVPGQIRIINVRSGMTVELDAVQSVGLVVLNDIDGAVSLDLGTVTDLTGIDARRITGAVSLDVSAVNAMSGNVVVDSVLTGGSFDLEAPAIDTIYGLLQLERVEGSLTCTLPVEHVGGDILARDMTGTFACPFAPHLRSVGAGLRYENTPITGLSLDSLFVVETVLAAVNNALLTHISAPSMVRIGPGAAPGSAGIFLGANPSLDSLAFPNLATLHGDLTIDDNNALPNLDGLAAVTSAIGSLVVTRNDSLGSVTGLNAIGDAVSPAVVVTGSFFDIFNNPFLGDAAALNLYNLLDQKGVGETGGVADTDPVTSPNE